MNDDLVVQKILKLLEGNTAFVGYAINSGIGTKINVRNTETGKTIQAVSINVDSPGEILVVKDSSDGQYKAVNFKTAGKVAERIIQVRKTKPVDDKKEIDYTDSDIEVFYLFVKLIDTGSPVPSQLTSTWIRKGSSCTEFVGAYERCNYASKATIAGVSYTGLPYIEYPSLQACLNDDLGRDAKTPHGTGDQQGLGSGYRIYATKMTAQAEQNLKGALESHDAALGTSFKKLFGYGTILECSGGMYVQGWFRSRKSQTDEYYFHCDFSYFPGYTDECTSAMQQAGYCTSQGFISSKTPLAGQELPGQPSVGNVDNSWGHAYGWVDLPYEFMYKRHFFPLYLDGQHAQGSFLILQVNEDQNPVIPEGYFLWTPGCPSNLGEGGPYDGSGGNRTPDGPAKPKKRDMKLSTHKAEIWLGSSKKKEALKLYELGASDLFSGMYNSFIIGSNESDIDVENRLKRNIIPTTLEQQFLHDKYYENRDKNTIDLRINPWVWIYIINNTPGANYVRPSLDPPSNRDVENVSLQLMVDNLYQRTINLTVVDKKTQVVHLKLGLKSKNILSNTDCKGTTTSFGNAEPVNDLLAGQSWEYQKFVTIKIKDWEIESSTNTLDTTVIPSTTWNKDYIERKFFTYFSKLRFEVGFNTQQPKDFANTIILRSDGDVSLTKLLSGTNYEQYNYTQAKFDVDRSISGNTNIRQSFISSASHIKKIVTSNDSVHLVLRSTTDWWAIWDKTILDSTNNRLNSIVGYDYDSHRVVSSWGFNPSLNYSGITGSNNNQVTRETYFDYLKDRPELYRASLIRAVRNKLISLTEGTIGIRLLNKENILYYYGLNYFFSHTGTQWKRPSISPPSIPQPESLYYGTFINQGNETREDQLRGSNLGSYYFRRLNTRNWINRLWVQFIYEGSVKVDVDSYKNVEFKHPSEPSKYIKYTPTTATANSEYSFNLQPNQTLETVLSPGVLDVSKQVPITKPTNVELDPNMSFLLYMYPYVEVTKKKKTI